MQYFILQTAERARRLHPDDRELQAAALIHDLGKVLFSLGEDPTCVVGDTFAVGCAFPQASIVYGDSLDENADATHPTYSTRLGVYAEGCGLGALRLSYGHDEYLYQVCQYAMCHGPWSMCHGPCLYVMCTLLSSTHDSLTLSLFISTQVLERNRQAGRHSLGPRWARAIRFHSFYPWHARGAYTHFMALDQGDDATLADVLTLNRCDLYSKVLHLYLPQRFYLSMFPPSY